jgi:ribonucleoside-diphosphate reductase alpha chain
MIKLRIPFESEEAIKVNEKIFATMYYHALVASLKLAKRDGPYESF